MNVYWEIMAGKTGIYMEGLNEVLSNLNKEAEKIKTRSMAGLIKGAIVIMNDTDNTSPIVPVDLGNLRASRFIVTARQDQKEKGAGVFKGERAGDLASNHSKVKSDAKTEAQGYMKPIVIFGFSANYAPYVHELVDRNYQRPGSGAKFLEESIKRNTKEVLEIIKNETKIK